MKPEKQEWQWIEGTVDPHKEHFKLLCGDSGRLFNENKRIVNVNEVAAEAGFDVVALIGRGGGNTFVVQFLLPENEETREILQRARHDINFYLVELHHEDISPWDYAIYHATSTFANFYSTIHWQYCPEKRTDDMRSTERETGAGRA